MRSHADARRTCRRCRGRPRADRSAPGWSKSPRTRCPVAVFVVVVVGVAGKAAVSKVGYCGSATESGAFFNTLITNSSDLMLIFPMLSIVSILSKILIISLVLLISPHPYRGVFYPIVCVLVTLLR